MPTNAAERWRRENDYKPNNYGSALTERLAKLGISHRNRRDKKAGPSNGVIGAAPSVSSSPTSAYLNATSAGTITHNKQR
jgi:hypothetical protein